MPKFERKTWYSPCEVADILDRHVETVRRWCRSGKIKTHRQGGRGHFMIPYSEVERELAELEYYNANR